MEACIAVQHIFKKRLSKMYGQKDSCIQTNQNI